MKFLPPFFYKVFILKNKNFGLNLKIKIFLNIYGISSNNIIKDNITNNNNYLRIYINLEEKKLIKYI